MGKFRLGLRGDAFTRAIAPALIIVMVLGLGFIGYNATRAATTRAEDIHLQDRLALQATLADLSSQYLQLAIAEAADFANAQPWSLKPGDPADTRRLSDFVGTSRLLNHGAALLGLTGTPINEASKDGGLPPPTDTGYQPMLASLVVRKPGVSSVIVYKGHPIVALAVPVVRNGSAVAILVAAFRADQSALESYTQKLSFGSTGTSFILDSRGGVVASHDPKLVGTRLTDAAARQLVTGHRGVLQFGSGSDARVGSFVPLSVGGWGSLSEQKADEFFGPIRTTGTNLQLILLGLLLIAGVGLGALNFKRQEAMREAALYDPLTGLYNRRALYTLGEHELKRAARSNLPGALVYVDLDNLKQINDTHGHSAGDQAICDAAAVLNAVTRTTDVVTRVGGDEFCALVVGMDPQVVASRVHEEAAMTRAREKRPYDFSLTVGIARFDPAHPTSIHDLIGEADRSMYFQKRSGQAEPAETMAGTS